MLGCVDMLVNGAVELAIVGDPASEAFHDLERMAADRYVPSLVVAGGAADGAGEIILLRDRDLSDGRATAYVCRNYACEHPATTHQHSAGSLMARRESERDETPRRLPTSG